MSPRGVQAFAARNLELLAAIENTLDALTADTDLLNAIAGGYKEVHELLIGYEGIIDADRTIGLKLEKASDTCARIYRDAKARHEAAQHDPQLQPGDGIADAYTAFLQALTGMHDVIESLREWIATHDAVLEPATSPVYSTVDDLFDALRPRP